MEMNIVKKNPFRYVFGVLMVAAILANIKSIFNDYNLDSGYAVVMAYRQAQGERLLSEMLEPHQTSGFLAAFLIKIYLQVFDTTTGLVLYLQAMGVLIRGIFAVFYYKTMKPLIRKDVLMITCLYFFSVSPKGLPLPEFSNMQVWFSLGLICTLIRYLQQQDKKYWLIMAGIFLALEVLAYPSCVIVYIGVAGILFRYASNKWKDIGIFTSVCACSAGLYCGWLLSFLGIEEMVHGIRNMILDDASHNMPLIDKFEGYMQEGMEIFIYFCVVGLIAYITLFVTDKALSRRKLEKLCTVHNWIMIFFLLVFLSEVLLILMSNMEYCIQVPMYIPILVTGALLYKQCAECEQKIFSVGLTISLLSFAATLVLTNLTLKSSLSYMIPAVMVSAVPITRGIEKYPVLKKVRLMYGLVFLFCGLIIFRSGYLFSSMAGTKANFLSLGGIVKSGPAVGVVSEYMGPYIFNATMQEWNELINEGESVLIVGGASYDPLYYLFKDVEISTSSTICTPTYDENLLEYWECYPEKSPDVIMVECWYGNLRVSQNSWIMQWLQEEKQSSFVDGKYWRYYRLE